MAIGFLLSLIIASTIKRCHLILLCCDEAVGVETDLGSRRERPERRYGEELASDGLYKRSRCRVGLVPVPGAGRLLPILHRVTATATALDDIH